MTVEEFPDSQRTRCEVWTRVMGYHRPTSHFNPGKLAEHRGRMLFREPAMTASDHVNQTQPEG